MCSNKFWRSSHNIRAWELMIAEKRTLRQKGPRRTLMTRLALSIGHSFNKMHMKSWSLKESHFPNLTILIKMLKRLKSTTKLFNGNVSLLEVTKEVFYTKNYLLLEIRFLQSKKNKKSHKCLESVLKVWLTTVILQPKMPHS